MSERLPDLVEKKKIISFVWERSSVPLILITKNASRGRPEPATVTGAKYPAGDPALRVMLGESRGPSRAVKMSVSPTRVSLPRGLTPLLPSVQTGETWLPDTAMLK